jgi:hypothetical protein
MIDFCEIKIKFIDPRTFTIIMIASHVTQTVQRQNVFRGLTRDFSRKAQLRVMRLFNEIRARDIRDWNIKK